MEQLKMTRLSAPVREQPFPEGFSVEYYSGLADQIDDWLAICREGLIEPGAGEEVFRAAILNYPDLDPEKDLIFVKNASGKRVATIAFPLHPGRAGYIHMVCCLRECRGLGIGDAMNSFALARLEERGVDYTYLTTDDFRLGAIKTYMRAGFVPCEEGAGMAERWKKVREALGE